MIEVRWPYAFMADIRGRARVLDMRIPHRSGPGGLLRHLQLPQPYEPGGPDRQRRVRARRPERRRPDRDRRHAQGFWAFKMDGFDGWNGHDWGMPNASSVQDWDNGPDGAPKKTV